MKRIELFVYQCPWCGAWTGRLGKFHLRLPFPVVVILTFDVKRPGLDRPIAARLAVSHGLCHACARREIAAIAARSAVIVRIGGHG